MFDDAAQLAVGAQLHHMQLVDRAVCGCEHPPSAGASSCQPRHTTITSRSSLGRVFSSSRTASKSSGVKGVVKGHDLHQPPALRTVKECIGARARQVLAGQLHRLVVLDVQVVVVDAVGGKANWLGRCGVLPPSTKSPCWGAVAVAAWARISS